jgi:hypothetical protein
MDGMSKEQTWIMTEREPERTSHGKEQRAGRLSGISSRTKVSMNNKNNDNGDEVCRDNIATLTYQLENRLGIRCRSDNTAM